jgi:hypothetical protein
MEKVFKKEITFLSKVAVMEATDENKVGDVIEVEVTKTAVFKEISRTNRSQHKLHSTLLSMEGVIYKDANGKFRIDGGELMTLSALAIETLLIVDNNNFTEGDKTEVLNDSFALINTGIWLFEHKLAPFFSTFKMN